MELQIRILDWCSHFRDWIEFVGLVLVWRNFFIYYFSSFDPLNDRADFHVQQWKKSFHSLSRINSLYTPLSMVTKHGPGVNFINILRADFSNKSALHRISLTLQFAFVIFCWKNIGAKAARKMLMKLNTVQIIRRS
jgi:hypothetical protein